MQREPNDKFLGRIYFKTDVYKKIFITGLALLFVMYLFLNSRSIGSGFLRILGILTPFIIGAVIAFIMKIPLNSIERRFFDKIENKKFQKYKRTLSILLSFVLIILAIAIIIGIILPQLIKSFKGLEESLPTFVQAVIDKSRQIPYINKYSDAMQTEYNNLSWQKAFKEVESFLSTKNASNFVGSAISTATSIVGGLVTFALSMITSIYILADKERLSYQGERLVYSFFSENIAHKTLHVAHLMHENFFGFIKGQLTVAFFIGVATSIFSFILRFPNAATLGVIVGVTDLVPVVGPFIGAAMGFILIVLEEPAKAVAFVILIIILQQVESNIVYPRLVGNNVGLPSLWTLIAITVGGSLFGVVGMWIFIPLVSTIYAILREYTEYKINGKNINLHMKKI